MFPDIPRHVLNNIMKFLICVACAVSLSWRKCETPHCLTCCRSSRLRPWLIVFTRLIWHTCTELAELLVGLACCTCMVLAKLFKRQSVTWDCLCGSSRCPSDGPGAKPQVCHPSTHYSGYQPCGDVTGMGSLCTTQNAVPNATKPRKRQPRVARGRARAKVAKEDVAIVILKTIVSKTARTKPCSPRHRGCPPTHRLV